MRYESTSLDNLFEELKAKVGALSLALMVVTTSCLLSPSSSDRLALKRYRVSGGAVSALVTSGALTATGHQEVEGQPAPEFGAFVVEGSSDGSFDAERDSERVVHIFGMVEDGDRLYAVLHKQGDSWMYSIDVRNPADPQLLEPFGTRDAIPDRLALGNGVLLGIGTGFAEANDFQVYDLNGDRDVPEMVGGLAFEAGVTVASVDGTLAAIHHTSFTGTPLSRWEFIDLTDVFNLRVVASPLAFETCGQDSRLSGSHFYCVPVLET